ncbi:MAG: DUF3800 domain-containing protein [Deltaproteobacteria bacterium]|nr:DUF3800 domain-containing protein [Deltaproteobacteria bacterium]
MSKNSQNRRLNKKKLKASKLKQKEEIIKSRYGRIGEIYCDESGNTGTNLLDSSQPVFVLGSCDFTESECKKLLAPLVSRNADEIKFVNLKRKASGQDAIVNIFKNRLVTPRRLMFSVMHKKFVTVTKIVDDLIENTLSREGFDLYQGARNVGLSNLLFAVIPSFCGQVEFDTLLERFMAMTKKRDNESIESFYAQIEQLNKISVEKGHNLTEEITLLLSTKKYVHDIFKTLPKDSNNPAVPALFALSYYWGRLYTKGINIKHDNSTPVEQQKQLLAHFSDMSQQKVKFGYGIREFELPLKVRKIDFLDSKDNYRLQLVDVFTSCFAYWLKHKIEDDSTDTFYKKLENIPFEQYLKNNVWPSLDVTPESLGADPFEIKENPADVTASFLHRAEAKSE